MTKHLHIKRIYDHPDQDDGFRVLVDRLWPRGVSKEAAHLDDWLREVAPSKELRTWWDHDPERMTEFEHRYQQELDGSDGLKRLQDILSEHHTVTLLYAAKDPHINHARILQEYVEHEHKHERS